MLNTSPDHDDAAFLRGGGRMGAMVRAFNWAATPLGPIDGWPQSLRTSVSTCLNCSFPLLIGWGKALVQIYNDAYVDILGDKHPAALGGTAADTWGEIWDTIQPLLHGVMARGEAFPAEDMRLVLLRHGTPEERYFSFSYSPIRDESGGVGGVFCPVVETTKRVLAERRAEFLLALEARLREIADPPGVKAAASEMLASYLGADQVGYAEVAEGGAEVIIEGIYGAGIASARPWRLRHADFGPAMVADLRAGQVVQICNVAADPRTADPAIVASYRRFRVAALLNVPLIKGGVLRAILFVHQYAPRAWSAEQVAHVRDVAERTWSAVERAAAEQALRHSEAEFRALGENMPNLCWMARADGFIYWYNRRWYEYTGTTPADMAGWGWQRVHDPAILPEVIETWQAALARGTDVDMTFPLRGADGTFRTFLTRVMPLRDENGAVARWFGCNTDITELREVEDRLRVSEAKLRQLNETLEAEVAARTAERDRMWRLSTDIMLVARPEGEIIAVNPAWGAMLGWREADVLGHSFMEFIHPDDRHNSLGRAAVLAEGRAIPRSETRYRHRDGSYRWIAWSSVPDAGLIHAVGRDISAEKDAAAQLEVAQDRLRQAQRMEALGQLAGGIAHDFNNVLQSVTGGMRLIRRRAEDPATVRQLADMVVESVARGASITGRLLTFARQGELQSACVAPAALVEGLAEMLAHTLGPGIAIVIEATPDLPPLLADRAQLETVLVNLAVNARDAMPEGGTLSISAQAETPKPGNAAGLAPGDYIRVAVGDTGCGMDSATLARAGEPFFTTKPLGRGTGLGLAMARGFAEQSGGALTISSVVGSGTTVSLWLPQAPAPEAAPPPAKPPPPARAAGTGPRVLLVDDDAMVRLTLAEHLAEEGYAVSVAPDGLSALAQFDAGGAFDLLVTDFAMPGMNGLSLIGEAKKRMPTLPVILLTGYADAGVRDAVASGALGDTTLLRKPVSPEELAVRAEAVLPTAFANRAGT